MQPMPQSICAIVCIYVYFGPTQRLLPGVIGKDSDYNVLKPLYTYLPEGACFFLVRLRPQVT